MNREDASPFENPAALRKAGIEALTKALGPLGMLKFLQQFETGGGDHTKERHLWLNQVYSETVLRDIEERRKDQRNTVPGDGVADDER